MRLDFLNREEVKTFSVGKLILEAYDTLKLRSPVFVS